MTDPERRMVKGNGTDFILGLMTWVLVGAFAFVGIVGMGFGWLLRGWLR